MKTLKLLILTASLLMPLSSLAGGDIVVSVNAPSVRSPLFANQISGDRIVDPHMEAGTAYACEECLNPKVLTVPGSTDFRELTKKVNLFSPDGKDPRKKYGTLGDGPIGLIVTARRFLVNGKVQVLKAESTGFLVSPCHVLTSSHGLEVTYTPEEMKKYGIAKIPGEESKFGFAYGTDVKKNFSLATVEDARYTGEHGSLEDDWALLFVDGCPGKNPEIGWLPILEVPRGVVPENISVRGYYQDLNEPEPKNKPSLYGQDNCKAVSSEGPYNSRIWTHFCASRPKASGSPLIGTYNGQRGVFAIMAAERKPQNKVLKRLDNEYSNTAVDISRIMPLISIHIEDAIFDYERATANRAANTKTHEI